MKKFRELRKELSEKLNSYTDVSNMTPEQRKKYQQEKLMAARNKLSKSNVAISRDNETNKDAVQEGIFSNPPLSSQQKKIMDGIKNILAKNSSEMNVQKAKMTIEKYSRANPQVDDKSIVYMKKMVDSYA
jgi:CHASE3 domain sensor protein